MQFRDPVCGMIVDSQTAGAEANYRSQHHYFCSVACRDRFEANPGEYLANPRTARDSMADAGREDLERHEPPRTVSGPIAAPKFGSAGSGGAEFEPLPEQHDD